MTLVDVSYAVGALSSETVTFTRYTQSRDSAGRASTAVASTFDAPFSVQPIGERTLRRLPENLREEAALVLVGMTDLQAPDKDSDPGDRFTWSTDGHTYEIQVEVPWAKIGGYRKYTARKVLQ